jgi:hypothetical protein
MLVFLLVLGGFIYYIMTPEERLRVGRPMKAVAIFAARHGARAAVAYVRAVRARKRWALGMPAAAAAIAIIILVSQTHMRQFIDVRPEVEHLVAAETRMSGTYAPAVEQFKLGAMSAEALAQLINRSIKPELQAARARLMAIDRVRAGHATLLTKAKEYVQLRDESWRLRAEALRKRNMTALRKADHAERASLAALSALEEARKVL